MSKGTITKITNKYDEYSYVNNNWDGARPQLFKAQETRVIVRVFRKDRRIIVISKEKNLTLMKLVSTKIT